MPKYTVLNPDKFQYANKLRTRQRLKSGSNAIILVDCDADLSLIPPNVTLTTPLVPRINFWEIHFNKNSDFSEENVKKLAKRLDAVAFMC